MAQTKILVVDEKEADLELLILQKFRRKIDAKEVEFVFARNALEALSELNNDPNIEIVLTDVEGLDLLTSLSDIPRLLKTVVVSPYGDIDSIRMAMNRGAFDFITRPINLQDLEMTIMKTIDQLQKSKEVLAAQSRLKAIEKELDVAKNIQNSIIPHQFNPFPERSDFEIFGLMLAAKQVGGDFFDFFRLNDHKIAFTIADVSGKGVPAALFMTMTRGLIRALGQKTLSPLNCFQQLNELLTLENESSMFVTAFYGIYDLESRTLEYCNAGHNPPYLLKKSGEVIQIGRSEGIALGVLANHQHYMQKSIQLEPGDTFVLYTDGVTEAMDISGGLFGEHRLEDALKAVQSKPLKDFVYGIGEAVATYAKGNMQSDDITILAIR